MQRSRLRRLLYAAVFGLFALPSHASLITFAYEGIVDTIIYDNVIDTKPFEGFLGHKIRVQYTFDSSLPDLNAASGLGAYSPLSAAKLTIGGLAYTTDNDFTSNISVYDNHQNLDGYVVLGPDYISGPTVGGLPAYYFILDMFAYDTTVFSSDALPLTQPDPADFDYGAGLSMYFWDGLSTVTVSTTTLHIAAVVPIPATVYLFATGMLGLISISRRKKVA